MSAQEKKRIAWSFSGAGRGHASRNLALIMDMLHRGYPVDIFSSFVGYQETLAHFQRNPKWTKSGQVRVFSIPGFNPVYGKKGEIDVGKMIPKNFDEFFLGVRAYKGLMRRFKRENYGLIVTDFEPLISRVAKSVNPAGQIVQVSSSYTAMIYAHCEPPPHLRAQYSMWLELVMRPWQPRPDHALITTFYRPERLTRIAQFTGPVLRDEILRMKPKDEGFVLAYVKPGVQRTMLPLIGKAASAARQKVIAYCSKVPSASPSPFVKLRQISLEGGFVEDLGRCSAVIGTAGIELPSETIRLGKPMLAVSESNQIEQLMNAHYMDTLGVGQGAQTSKITQDQIVSFFGAIPKLHESVMKYRKQMPIGTHTIPKILESLYTLGEYR